MTQWFENPGRPPTKWGLETMLAIKWANGKDARHTYTAGQLVWERRGWDHDIGWFRKA